MISSLNKYILELFYTGSSVRTKRKQIQDAVRISNSSTSHEIRQLLVDISIIIRGDSRTGIQRVVRALLSELEKYPPATFKICPVFATNKHGYHYAPDAYQLGITDIDVLRKPNKQVHVNAGDIFLGLDLSTTLFPKYEKQVKSWKLKGVKIHVIIYDLLPVQRPEWFHRNIPKKFYKWLRSIAISADSLICISEAVQRDLQNWLSDKYSFSIDIMPVHVIPLGGDLEKSVPSRGMPQNAKNLLSIFTSRKTALMVGTLEPRKGHSLILDAFDVLWKQGSEANLLIVGKLGWKTDKLKSRLLNHEQYEKKLFWLSDVSDQYLDQIYHASFGLILASEGEGFGLPILEALMRQKNMLVSDLPVFREISSIRIQYFERFKTDAFKIAETIEQWLSVNKTLDFVIKNEDLNVYSWNRSATKLVSIIAGHESLSEQPFVINSQKSESSI
jgi:glycosyltransferase involved in cell wall biosynthesis